MCCMTLERLKVGSDSEQKIPLIATKLYIFSVSKQGVDARKGLYSRNNSSHDTYSNTSDDCRPIEYHTNILWTKERSLDREKSYKRQTQNYGSHVDKVLV